MNFVYYNENYDKLRGTSKWAYKSLEEYKSDERTYLYSKEELEDAKTHDKHWNVVQEEVVKTGKMHGYMRMYWGKKILEWTQNPEKSI